MRKIFNGLRKKDFGAIGIGAMIVFIAMVLVAGIAASVLIQTSTKLESQAMQTGTETTEEVATGLAVYDIKGSVTDDDDDNIDDLIIGVRARAGSKEIDLSTCVVEISDGTNKIVLSYGAADGTYFQADGSGIDGIFSQTIFPTNAYQFGLLVVEDADDSVSAADPVINKGDKVLLGVTADQIFTDGIDERTDVFGTVMPETGSPGVIGFTSPASYNDVIIDLQ